MSSELMIEMKNVHKWFGELHVLNDINLEINKGEKIVICGPSGSGKSTLIRCINRLEEHQRGNIIVEGTELTNDSRSIERIRGEVAGAPPGRRHIHRTIVGFVEQHLAFSLSCPP